MLWTRYRRHRRCLQDAHAMRAPFSIVLLFGLVFWPAVGTSQQTDTEPETTGQLVYCYEPTRELIQRLTKFDCDGRVVDKSKAREIRKRIQQRRAETIRNNFRAAEPDRRVHRSGSGAVISTSGHVLTAAHVIEGCGRITVHRPDGETFSSRLVTRHPTADLAVVAAEGLRAAPVPVAHNWRPTPQQALRAVGYPLHGRVAVRPISTELTFLGQKQVGQPSRAMLVVRGDVQRGNSGGPLLTRQGRLVGIVAAKVHTPSVFAATGKLIRNIGLAESLAHVKEVLEQADVRIDRTRGGDEKPAMASIVRLSCKAK